MIRLMLVQVANDCYADIEIAHLLQRMAPFNGVAILATKLRALHPNAIFDLIYSVLVSIKQILARDALSHSNHILKLPGGERERTPVSERKQRVS